MKKFLLVLSFIFYLTNLYCWNDCPYGIENDSFPGLCPRYIDTDTNSICDLSENSPEERDMLIVGTENLEDSEEIEIISENKRFLFFKSSKYFFFPITLVIIILYSISAFLLKKKKITRKMHTKIWNIVLLLSFSASSIFAILTMIQVNLITIFSIIIKSPINLVFWHVETAIIMMDVAIFHIFWHRKYFKNIFK